MQITFSHDMLAVTLQDDAKTFYHLQNIVKKNFSKKIGRKNKTIIFKQDNEEVQRRYFLNLISKMYIKSNDLFDLKTANKVKESLNKTIKITHLKSNELQQQLKIKVNIEDNYAIVFSLDSQNSVLVSYIKNYFKEHLVNYRARNLTITIYTQSQNTALLLEKLLNKNEIIGCYIDFEYNISEFLEFKKSVNKKSERRRKFNALFSLLEEYYEVLECKCEDSFEIVRKQYLKLVKQYHPDSYTNTNMMLHSQHIEKFQTIQHAYEMIKVHFEHEKSA